MIERQFQNKRRNTKNRNRKLILLIVITKLADDDINKRVRLLIRQYDGYMIHRITVNGDHKRSERKVKSYSKSIGLQISSGVVLVYI